jgi:ubiquinone/menaquinone biosynthesis C-methylase UbiE
MNHEDHIRLLHGGIPDPGGVWADFGSGTGAFTLALAELVGPQAEIYSIDRDRSALRQQEKQLRDFFPEGQRPVLHTLAADFTRRLEIPLLNGVVMANALHFQRRKELVVELIQSYLRPGGHFVLVEYNVDHGNPWVPYPLSYQTWENLAQRCGFAGTRWLTSVPSRFLKEIYSALSWNSRGINS